MPSACGVCTDLLSVWLTAELLVPPLERWDVSFVAYAHGDSERVDIGLNLQATLLCAASYAIWLICCSNSWISLWSFGLVGYG